MNKPIIASLVGVLALAGISAQVIGSRSHNRVAVTSPSPQTTTPTTAESLSTPAASAAPAPAAANQPGEYSDYDPAKLARANGGKVVIFFAAKWCGTCQELDRNIRTSLSSIPANVTILNADYDTQQQLKQRYRVTFQHTLVEVDAQGNQLKKWDHSPTLDALLGQII